MARTSRLDEAVGWLRQRLPDGWTIRLTRRASGDGVIQVAAPSGASAEFDVRALKDAAPRSVSALTPSDRPTLVVADWLSARAQQVLRTRGASFLDSTGNAEIRLSEPGLFLRTEGAKHNPSPAPTKGPTLRGPKAWALMRTLAEVLPPMGVRELAEAVDVDPGYVSRVVRVLEPYNPIVFERMRTSDGIPTVSVAQAVLDCLQGNARMPAEGEALLAWMRTNEARWRTGTLTACTTRAR